jgi:hypothetical protein
MVIWDVLYYVLRILNAVARTTAFFVRKNGPGFSLTRCKNLNHFENVETSPFRLLRLLTVRAAPQAQGLKLWRGYQNHGCSRCEQKPGRGEPANALVDLSLFLCCIFYP